jgi:hypothetical protein
MVLNSKLANFTTSNNGDNILTYILRYCPDEKLVKLVLKQSCAKDLLESKANPFLLACRANYECAIAIAEHASFDNKYMAATNEDKLNCIGEAALRRDSKLVNYLLAHSGMTKDIFENCVRVILMVTIDDDVDDLSTLILNHPLCSTEALRKDITMILQENHNIDNMKCLLKSKYFDKTLLLIKNANQENMLTYSLKANTANSSWQLSHDLLKDPDAHGRTAIYYASDIDIILAILDSEHFDSTILAHQDNEGLTAIHYQYKYRTPNHSKTTSLMLGSKHCNAQILRSQEKNTLESVITNMCTYNITEEILRQPYIAPDDLVISDANGYTCLHNMMELDNKQRFDQIKLVLESDKCSPKLLEQVTTDGHTFLMMDNITEELLQLVLNSEHCRPELLTKVNKENKNLLIDIMEHCPTLTQLLINNNKATKELLLPTNPLCDPFLFALSLAHDAYIDLMLCKYFCAECITPNTILLCCQNKMEGRLDAIIRTNYDLPIDHNTLKYAVYSTPTIFKKILDTKYITKEMLLKNDNNMGHNTVTRIFCAPPEYVKYFIESRFWSPEIMYNSDIDGDSLLIRTYRHPETAEYALNSCTFEFVHAKNKIGSQCSHHFAQYSPECFSLLLKSKHCTQELVALNTDLFGRTPLHIAAQKNPEVVEAYFNSRFCSESAFSQTDKQGRNVLMLLLMNPATNSKFLHSLVSSRFCTTSLLQQKDNNNDNTIFYAARYNSPILNDILGRKELLTKQLFTHRNNDFWTPVMYAARYNADSVLLLLKSGYTDLPTLTSLHTDYATALTIAARYTPPAVGYILAFPGIDHTLVDSHEDSKDFVEIACTYNGDSIKHAVESKYDLSHLINDTSYAIILAAKYQPEAVKHYLDSKYVTQKIWYTRFDKKNCVDEAFDCQPRSLLYMINSKIATHDLLNQPDQIGYRLFDKIRQIYPTFSNFADLKNNTLTDHVNTVADELSPLTCTICCTYKTRVAFTCGHAVCISCGFKLKNCAHCRAPVDKRSVIYDA